MARRICERDKGSGPARGPLTTARYHWRRLTQNVLGRDLALVLALKVALVIALYVFLIRPAPHPSQDPAATAAAVVGAASGKVHEVKR